MELLLLILIVSNVACALAVINLAEVASRQREALHRLSMDVFKFNMDLIHHSIQMNLLQVSLEIQEDNNQKEIEHDSRN